MKSKTKEADEAMRNMRHEVTVLQEKYALPLFPVSRIFSTFLSPALLITVSPRLAQSVARVNDARQHVTELSEQCEVNRNNYRSLQTTISTLQEELRTKGDDMQHLSDEAEVLIAANEGQTKEIDR